ncbi:MAG: serine/threonine-protein kinase, partial [Planctomyces sp.]
MIKVGDSVEGYRVISEIGRGAASAIYLVQDPSSKQIWALKQVIKHMDKDERFLEQTESEYAIASKLDHRNIRKVHKLIKKRPGLLRKPDELLMLMELADGQPLEKLPPRTFEMAAKIFEQVARALAYMHSRGFVHADMKPNNIIADADGFAKVIDLGQSCAVNTIKKRIQGTPDYIAPEQVHRKPITEKTDVYNLGATMYWTLTRRNVPTALGSDESLLGHIDESMMA